MKVFSDKENPNTWKILVAAKYNGLTIETPDFVYGVDNKSEEFLQKSPFGKVPVLETDKGSIFEANAAARYVAKLGKNKIYGASPFEAAQVEQWIDFTASEIDLPSSVWIFPILGQIPNNPVATQKAKGDIRRVLGLLDKILLTKTFLVGERISLADIVVAFSLYRLFTRVLDPGFRKPFTNVNRWFSTLINQSEFVAVVGKTVLCEKMEVAPEAPAEEVKEVKEEKKVEKKPKPKKEKEPEEEEDDFAKEEKPKGKNPLDELPPTSFVMDEWKRTYSNEDTRTKAIPWFWEKLDTEGYSIWFADYKYSKELEKVFMTCNLVGGFLQRLDKLRKYGFGSVIIFGEDSNLDISSCWLFRGQDIPAEMLECDDSETYTWRKADLKDPATRELINDFWAWEGSFGGRKVNQGKVFK